MFIILRLIILVLISLVSPQLLANSRGVTVEYKASEANNAAVAGSMQLYTNSYALVIGIDDYSNGWPKVVEWCQRCAQGCSGP
ncbi:MAG: hypothetical protein NWS22_02515 [Porticoccaceae bacterium]|jgi:hypothetical protein|nr:hypothetical protein [Porticoccaceae bacterium]